MAPFEPGHPGYKNGGRPKGSKTGTNKNTSLDVYRHTDKDWEKKPSRRTINIEDANYYIYNDLPLDGLYENMKFYNKYEDEE